MILNADQITERLSDLPGWEFQSNQLQRSFLLKDDETAEKLAGQVAMAADVLNHHPDVEKAGNQVNFKLSTHSENGVTEKDFALAKEIEEAASILL